jgi:chromate transporter
MYKEVLAYFLRLGCLGFGGPLALISSMQKDLVEKKKWMSESDFNASFSLIKAMPGPVAFQTAVFLGRERAGFWGGCLAAFGIVFPPFVLMILFSLFVSRAGDMAITKSFFLGMQLAALGVILGSLKGLIRTYWSEILFWVLVVISGIINFKHPSLEPIIIVAMGLLIVAWRSMQNESHDLAPLFLVCFKAGALVFGTGLAVVPMLSHDVVDKYHWLTQSEFLDAITFGQMTPGPVVITATYIGHKVDGMLGAVVATLGMFLAAFFHMTTWFPHVVKKLTGKKWINDFVFGAIAAVVGPIVVTVIKMSLHIEPTITSIVLGIAAFVFTFTGTIPIWMIIPLGGVVKLLLSLVY